MASGLMKQEYDRVKLHCTLINSLFRKVTNDFAMTLKYMDDEDDNE